MKSETWQPKIGEQVLWQMSKLKRGLERPARRVLVLEVFPNGTVSIKLDSTHRRVVKTESLSRIRA